MLHTHLTSEKWKSFSLDKQILMIANEINRAKNWITKKDFEKVSYCHERAFELIDLTVDSFKNKSLIRELLRFRELIATEYVYRVNNDEQNMKLFKVLLSLNLESYNIYN
ncbi:MAG: hypothetical protein B1H05_01605 [Candidatus Cloacimonas sp. 4484_140]|nr:MAG: hypothetical protein B1H05_01605 [Candidatus Cloacimonas sp. 4484_140]